METHNKTLNEPNQYLPVKVIIIISLLGFLFFIAGSAYAEDDEYYFVCDILNNVNEESSARPFDGEIISFDLLFSYKKEQDNTYTTDGWDWYGVDNSLGSKFENNIISEVFIDSVRTKENEDHYREKVFRIYRFNITDNTAIQSYLYYVSQEGFDRDFNNDQFLPYNNPFLFDFVSEPLPKDYVKIGWDKSKWQCYPISFWKYNMFRLQSLIFILAI